MFGVSEKKSFEKDHSETYKFAFGIAHYIEQYYPKPGSTYWPHHNHCNKDKFRELIKGEVDLLLDLEKDTLSICVVGHCNSLYQAKLMCIPKNEHGWVPHFNTNSQDQTLQIAKIPVDWYGNHEDNVFDLD